MATFTEEEIKALENEKRLEEESKLQKENANFIQEPEPEIIVLPVEEPQIRELWLFNTETNKVEYYSNDIVGFANNPQYRPATDKEIKAFQLETEFENARELKLMAFERLKQQKLYEPLSYKNYTLITTEKAQFNILGQLMSKADKAYWLDANGNAIELTKLDFAEIRDLIHTRTSLVYHSEAIFKAQINQAKTKEEAEAIKIEFPEIETHTIDI
jgi:hypothetical protein